MQVHKCRTVPSGNAGPFSGSIAKEVYRSTHFMSLILTWSSDQESPNNTSYTASRNFLHCNYGFFRAGEVGERITNIVRPVKTSGSKMKENYFVEPLQETFVTVLSIVFSSESHTGLKKIL